MKTYDEGIRTMAAELVRAWAERRRVLVVEGILGDKRKFGQQDRYTITDLERKHFEDCAGDIERGLP